MSGTKKKFVGTKISSMVKGTKCPLKKRPDARFLCRHRLKKTAGKCCACADFLDAVRIRIRITCDTFTKESTNLQKMSKRPAEDSPLRGYVTDVSPVKESQNKRTSVPELKDKIVSDSEFLVDALKSLITAEQFQKTDLLEEWKQFKKDGKLRTSFLDAVWSKGTNRQFQENREHLLALMEHLNIIARPLVYAEHGESQEDAATKDCHNYYVVPCVLKKCPKELLCLQTKFISTSWLCLDLQKIAFPNAIFIRLLAGCISRWHTAIDEDEYYRIYSDWGQFDLDENVDGNALHRLTVKFTRNVIALAITRYDKEEPDVSICQDVHSIVKQILLKIGKSLSIEIKYEEKIQCPLGHTFKDLCMHTVQKLAEKDKMPCHKHKDREVFQSRNLLKYWFDPKETNYIDLTPENADRTPTDKEIGRISKRIGSSYQLLALELGIDFPIVEQFKEAYPTNISTQIICILREWRKNKANQATFKELVKAMEVVEIDVEEVLKNCFK